jgi:nucleotide-binding universal stress UspA family protein
VAADARRSLVFGDDGSPGADRAWRWISEHPWPGWALTVLTGHEPPFEDWAAPATPAPWTPPWADARPSPSTFDSVEVLYADADPRVLLDGQAADLTVVGPAGHEPELLGWLGSTAEWLLHHPSHPIAIVRGAAVASVMCCVDGSAHAPRALDAYLSLPLARDAALSLVAVDDGRIDVDAVLDEATAVVTAAGLTPGVERLEGRPTSSLLVHVSTWRPDLVVLGTRGLTPWKRLALGSTAGALAHRANTTVLLAAAPAAS